ncbi:hypothetical protein ILUMI_22883 [Ignelater luminosus]|uniref:beta-glucosidase n=1 Tax=Ignelater luminosus TaxID=2038154 RepID=A0A8K0CBX7_IGNLU|nr:hypothetical protein ILUMI_22883 [Ignelater luminosus]
MITLIHFDLPQVLQDLGGFTNTLIIKYFVKYAKFVFENFGDRVKTWTTFNEPHIYCLMGYGQDSLAPAYSLSGIGEYICSHNVLKAHAAIYHLYNDTFREKQHGKIIINLDSAWFEPASNSKDDIEASDRALQFELGFHAHPIFSKTGDYPSIVKKRIAERSAQEGLEESRLPLFTQKEIEYIRGTHDNIFCIAHYTTKLATTKAEDPIGSPSFEKDMNVHSYFDPSWPPTAFPVFRIVPWGIKKLVMWIKQQYDNPIIYISENGLADNGELKDQERIKFHKSYLTALLEAVNKHGVRVKRYSAWSFMDSFEWSTGYTLKYGFYHVDFNDSNRTRKAKASAYYYKGVISTRKP